MNESNFLFLSRKQVASRYNVHTSTLWRWMSQEGFPKPMTISGRVKRWSLQDLENFETRLKSVSGVNLDRE